MKQLRILFYTSFPTPITGQNVATETLYDFLGDVADSRRINTSVDESMATGSILKRVQGAVSALWQLRVELKRFQPDILYVVLSSSRGGRLRDLATVLIARPHVRQLVGHVHVGDFAASLGEHGLRRSSRALLRRIDSILALSPRLAGPIEEVSQKPVQVLPNTVSEAFRVPPSEVELKQRDRAEAEVLRIAFVSNMLPGKGFELAAEGIARYNASSPERPAEVDFVGAWPSPARRAAFEGRLAALGLQDASRVWGAVQDRGWIRDLYLRADVALLPTQYAHEALPITLLEALATGTPVIGTDWAALPDLVTPSTGVLLASPSPQAIADALQTLADPAVWQSRSQGARELYESAYHPALVRRSFLDILGVETPAQTPEPSSCDA